MLPALARSALATLLVASVSAPALAQQPIKTPFDPPEAKPAATKKQPGPKTAKDEPADPAPTSSTAPPMREGPPTPETAPAATLVAPPGVPVAPLVPGGERFRAPAMPAAGAPFPPSAPLQPAAFDSGSPAASGPDWRLIGGVASMVVGAASFVVMGVALARLDTLQDDAGFTAYRHGLTPSQSACGQAAAGTRVSVSGAGDPAAIDELCSEADAWEVATYVTLPAGIVLLGAGAALVITSDTVRGTNSSLRFVPRVGQRHAGAALTLDF